MVEALMRADALASWNLRQPQAGQNWMDMRSLHDLPWTAADHARKGLFEFLHSVMVSRSDKFKDPSQCQPQPLPATTAGTGPGTGAGLGGGAVITHNVNHIGLPGAAAAAAGPAAYSGVDITTVDLLAAAVNKPVHRPMKVQPEAQFVAYVKELKASCNIPDLYLGMGEMCELLEDYRQKLDHLPGHVGA